MRRVAGEGRVYGPRRGASTGRGVMERVRVYDDERLGNWLLSLLEKRQEMRETAVGKRRTRVWHGGNRPRRRACVVSVPRAFAVTAGDRHSRTLLPPAGCRVPTQPSVLLALRILSRHPP